MDATTGKVLASVNAHRQLPMASTTKVMTAVVAIENGNLTDRITVPKAAFNYEWDATVMGLKPGQVVTLQQLLYGLLLSSGADAANTIAIHYGGSEAKFVAMMNAEAQRLGMRDTHYVNAHGLTAANHHTSAYDLAVLGRYASTLAPIMKVVGTKTYNWNGHVLTNLNRPLFWYPGVDGIKPGFTDDAGLCQVLDARRHGRHVIVAILNTPDLVIDARNYLNFGLRDFTWTQSALSGDGPSFQQEGVDSSGLYDYFPATGHYIRGHFLDAFNASGGVAALGFPRTEQLTEGSARVQYFQNGALSVDPRTGSYHRLALGLTPVPSTVPVTPSPPPATTPTPTPKPVEATIVLPRRTPTPNPKPVATPTPHPKPTPTATVRATVQPKVASVFASFHGKHASLGNPVSAPFRIGPRTIQVFRYGALDYNSQNKYVALLPIGDRLLAARHFLPKYAGNSYPSGFASDDVLRAIGWLPSTTGSSGH